MFGNLIGKRFFWKLENREGLIFFFIICLYKVTFFFSVLVTILEIRFIREVERGLSR